MDPKTDLSEYERKKKSIAPLVFETPCEHMKDFGPCLAEVTVYKWKLATKMATALGFPTETHKLMLVTPVDFEGKKLDFEPMVLELNFGSKKLFSSGTYMRCLKCAEFSDKAMLKCSEPFICCIEKDYIINAMKSYVETIQFFGPRKCNCQSFCYYILSCFGVPEKEILDNKVVETDSGYIRGKVKELAAHMEYDRPTCKGDKYTKKTGGSRRAVAPLEIPSILGQFEMDEFKDEVGQHYLRFLFGFSISTSMLVLLVAIFLFYWFAVRS